MQIRFGWRRRTHYMMAITLLYLAAYAGGLLTTASPCIIPVLPLVFTRTGKRFSAETLEMLAGLVDYLHWPRSITDRTPRRGRSYPRAGPGSSAGQRRERRPSTRGDLSRGTGCELLDFGARSTKSTGRPSISPIGTGASASIILARGDTTMKTESSRSCCEDLEA